MYGNNPKRPPVNSDGRMLDIQEIFPTKQGEGPNTGQPAVFVRLGGCNLACTFCDTEFESFAAIATDDVVAQVKKHAENSIELVVITGGEPLRHNIAYLCEQLLANNLKVQIETNGTLFRPLPQAVEIICSPKNTGNGYSALRPDLLRRVNALKFIISAQDEKYNHVPNVGQSEKTPIYLQPMDEYNDEKNLANKKLAEQLCKEHGYNLSLQMHKIWGLP